MRKSLVAALSFKLGVSRITVYWAKIVGGFNDCRIRNRAGSQRGIKVYVG